MTNATNAAVAMAKKSKKVSHAKQEQATLPLPVPAGPEFGLMAPGSIVVVDQVRKEFDEEALRELAEDIAQRGILQPLTVRKTDAGFVLVAGERRLRAAKLAQLESVPVLICDIDDTSHALNQLAENIQRADLNLSEEANAIALLYAELGTVAAVASKVHKSAPWVSKRLSLAKGLGYWASELLASGKTEDIELLQTVDKLENTASGSNACYSLVEKIKAGTAGREDAREALRRANERKQPASEKTKKEVKADPLEDSANFRQWLKFPHPHAINYLNILWAMADGGVTQRSQANYEAVNEEVKRLESALSEAKTKREKLLAWTAETIDKAWHKLDVHNAHQSYFKKGETK